mgnify:FL=1
MNMKPYYSKKVIKHFLNPKNFGEIKDADGIGRVGNSRCGDEMLLMLKVGEKDGKEIIKDIKFKTLGCAAAIATSDMICELVKNKTLDEALGVGFKDVAGELGSLPPVKIHCAYLAQEGLKAAVEDYRNKKKKSKSK